MSADCTNDIVTCDLSVPRERQGRDRGRWQRMREYASPTPLGLSESANRDDDSDPRAIRITSYHRAMQVP
jgi:hypothetical protein